MNDDLHINIYPISAFYPSSDRYVLQVMANHPPEKSLLVMKISNG